jgi:hypothetical protein
MTSGNLRSSLFTAVLAVEEFRDKLKESMLSFNQEQNAVVQSGAKIRFVGDLDEFYGSM